MPILSRALRIGTQLQTLKLENCGLSGRPIIILGKISENYNSSFVVDVKFTSYGCDSNPSQAISTYIPPALSTYKLDMVHIHTSNFPSYLKHFTNKCYAVSQSSFIFSNL